MHWRDPRQDVQYDGPAQQAPAAASNAHLAHSTPTSFRIRRARSINALDPDKKLIPPAPRVPWKGRATRYQRPLTMRRTQRTPSLTAAFIRRALHLNEPTTLGPLPLQQAGVDMLDVAHMSIYCVFKDKGAGCSRTMQIIWLDRSGNIRWSHYAAVVSSKSTHHHAAKH